MSDDQSAVVVLEPCPFCGGESICRNETETTVGRYVWFRCESCGCETEGETGLLAASTQWNRRAAPKPTLSGEATVAEQAIRHLSRLVRVYGDMLDGNGNTPTEIRHAERFLSALSSLLPGEPG